MKKLIAVAVLAVAGMVMTHADDVVTEGSCGCGCTFGELEGTNFPTMYFHI